MSVLLANLENRLKKITLTIGTEKINVTYNPGVITSKWIHDGRPAIEALPEAIKSWDLEDEGGAVPVSAEGLKKIPYDVVMLIWKKILVDVTYPREDAGEVAPPSLVDEK
jgi:hypothetical protein